jgi:hypothetical protein
LLDEPLLGLPRKTSLAEVYFSNPDLFGLFGKPWFVLPEYGHIHPVISVLVVFFHSWE